MQNHFPNNETFFLCRTIWPDGILGLDGGTAVDPRDVVEWVAECRASGMAVQVSRIECDVETGAPETITDVTEEMLDRVSALYEEAA